jgi:hypothetical protein
MSHGTDRADPLARAIAEFRQEFLLWIDRELARGHQRDPGAGRGAEERSTAGHPLVSGPRGGSQPRAQPEGVAPRAERPVLLAELGREPPREEERFADRSREAEITAAPRAGAGPEMETETDSQPQAGPANPRHRLDALARLLDHRLKQVDGAAAVRRVAASRRDQENPDEALSPSGDRGAEWASDGA